MHAGCLTAAARLWLAASHKQSVIGPWGFTPGRRVRMAWPYPIISDGAVAIEKRSEARQLLLHLIPQQTCLAHLLLWSVRRSRHIRNIEKPSKHLKRMIVSVIPEPIISLVSMCSNQRPFKFYEDCKLNSLQWCLVLNRMPFRMLVWKANTRLFPQHRIVTLEHRSLCTLNKYILWQ